MRFHASIAIALVLLGASTSAQTLSPDQRLGDLRQILQLLPQRHPKLFANVPEAGFRAAAAQLETDNPRLTNVEFYTRVAALIAMARDGHTRLGLSSQAASNLGFRQLPVQLRWFTDGIFVTAAPLNRADLLGGRLTAIGGVPIEDVLTRLRPIVSYENEFFFRSSMPSILTNEGVLRGAGIVSGNASVTYGLRLASGEETAVELSAATGSLMTALDAGSGFAPWFSRHADQNYWAEYQASSRTMYIRYNACVEQLSRPINTFTEQVLALIESAEVDTMVFDVRDNGGGNSELIVPLLQGLSQRMGRLKQNTNFRLYTIANGGTYSSGVMTVEYLMVTDAFASQFGSEYLGLNSALVGEGTGGKPTHFGNVKDFSLSNSGLTVIHSTVAFETPPWVPDRDSIYPDVQMSLRSTDYFTRHDPWLAIVLARTKRLPSPPEGNVTVVNAASFRLEQAVAPGSFAAAFGTFPASQVTVEVAGSPSEITSAGASQIVFRMPNSVTPGMASIEVREGSRVAAQGRFEVAPAAPALFVLQGQDPTQPGAVLNEDGAVNGRLNGAARGSIVQIFGTGDATAGATALFIGGSRTETTYSGMVAPGLWQVNAIVPQETALGRVPVYLATGEAVSNAVTIEVR